MVMCPVLWIGISICIRGVSSSVDIVCGETIEIMGV